MVQDGSSLLVFLGSFLSIFGRVPQRGCTVSLSPRDSHSQESPAPKACRDQGPGQRPLDQAKFGGLSQAPKKKLRQSDPDDML